MITQCIMKIYPFAKKSGNENQFLFPDSFVRYIPNEFTHVELIMFGKKMSGKVYLCRSNDSREEFGKWKINNFEICILTEK